MVEAVFSAVGGGRTVGRLVGRGGRTVGGGRAVMGWWDEWKSSRLASLLQPDRAGVGFVGVVAFRWFGESPLVRQLPFARRLFVGATVFCRSDASRELFGRARTPPDPAQPVPVRTVAFCRSDASRELFGPTSPMSAEGRMVEPFSSAVGRAAHAAASPRAREGVRIRR